jgi:hypothetical protein
MVAISAMVGAQDAAVVAANAVVTVADALLGLHLFTECKRFIVFLLCVNRKIWRSLSQMDSSNSWY